VSEPVARLLIVDLSVNPAIYRPVEHWRPHVEACGVAFDVCRPPANQWPRAGLDGYSHALLTGSEASINQDTAWILGTCKLTRALAERGVALLGSCFGHQLLARALSGKAFVRRSPTPEFGWVEVVKAAALEPDPLAEALPERSWMYCAHFDEACDLTDDWVTLATSAHCAHAVMRWAKGRAWGLQPHPEIGVDEGKALYAALLSTMPDRKEVLTAAFHPEPRDSLLTGAIVKAFLAPPP
jgi:GMP synthase-like glutamine amidotransferase